MQSLYRRHTSWTESSHRYTYDLCASLHDLGANGDGCRLSSNVGALASVLEAFHAATANHLSRPRSIGEVDYRVVLAGSDVDDWQIFELDTVEELTGRRFVGEDVLFSTNMQLLVITARY